jgi:hypothetical protein
MEKELRPVKELRGHPKNYNRHSPEEIMAIRASLSRFNQYKPIVVWKGYVLTGHGVFEAALQEGVKEIWVEDRSDLTDAEALALMVGDNEIAKMATPDEALLQSVLALMKESDPSLVGLSTGGQVSEQEITESMEKMAAQAASGYTISPELLERQDYVVFVFSSELDWRAVCDEFAIDSVVERPPEMIRAGIQAANRGTGRVLDGKMLLEKVRHV